MEFEHLKKRDYSEVMGQLEAWAQALWFHDGVDRTDLDTSKKRRYVLGMFPYPSGKAHLGHIMVYSIADALARMGRFKGEEVLNPLGWDAFGLPAENAAIKHGAKPQDWTAHNIKLMREQITRAGFSFDLRQELNTSSPDFYRWTQWLFLKLYEHGQAYRSSSWVNWDPVDETVLANEQVIDGKGWRSGALVERRQMELWCLRITDFAQELHDGLTDLKGWSQRAVNAQRHWIGRSEGAAIDFAIGGDDSTLTIYTTRPDTLFGVTSLTLAPEHPLVLKLAAPENLEAVRTYVESSLMRNEVERQTEQKKTGVSLGRHALHPFTGTAIPIWVSEYVIGSHGSGAIMNVPAHDQRDFDFALVHNIPIRSVIVPTLGRADTKLSEAYTGPGTMVGSGEFDGMSSEDARLAIVEKLEALGTGRRSVAFRLRDWSIGRQRYWGCPIPMVRHQDGSWSPVPEDELPVTLPNNVRFGVVGTRSPLSTAESFATVTKPDGEVLHREVDTMDTFMDSAWYAWRFLSGCAENAWPVERAEGWMPVDYYVGGLEHATQHMIYFRYIAHFLHSLGLTPTKEPVAHFLDNGMIKLGGSKMSKSRGNTVSPEDLISEHGADALRLYILSDTPFELDREWDDTGLVAKQRFLGQVWRLGIRISEITPTRIIVDTPEGVDGWSQEALALLSLAANQVESAVDERHSFHKAIAQLHAFVSALSNLEREVGESEERRTLLGFAFQNFLKMLGLFAPHIAEFLWQIVTKSNVSLFAQHWVPEIVDQRQRESVEIPLQMNGKKVAMWMAPTNATDEAISDAVVADPPARIFAALESGELRQIIVVRGPKGSPRLINLVIA